MQKRPKNKRRRPTYHIVTLIAHSVSATLQERPEPEFAIRATTQTFNKLIAELDQVRKKSKKAF